MDRIFWDRTIEALEIVFKDLKQTQRVRDWKVKQKPYSFKIETLNFEELAGMSVSPEYIWDASKSDYVFAKRINIPSAEFGIETTGSNVQLHIKMISSAEIYLNGKSVARDRFWFDAYIQLTNYLRPRDTFDVAIKAQRENDFCGYGFTDAEIIIDKVDSVITKIETFLYELKLIKKILEIVRADKKKEYGYLLTRALTVIDLEAIRKKDVLKVINSIQKAKEILRKMSPEIKKYKVCLVGHSHIDMNWLWYWENTLEIAHRTFNTVDKLMSEFKDFKFSQSQAYLYQAVENNFPSLFRCIKKRIKEDKWDVTASMWVESDLNMASGEAIVRQILYAKRYVKEKFGVTPRVCWSLDIFGHPWTLPQILKKSRLDYYHFTRCGKGKHIFWWQGPDGSRVLAFNHPGSYNGIITPEKLIPAVLRGIEEKSNVYLFTYGVGDHGGGPTRRELKRAQELRKDFLFPTLKFSTVQECFEEMLRENKNYPVIKDELNFIYEGCYTTHADIKYMNRYLENTIPVSEMFSSIAEVYGLKYDRADFETCWQKACFNQFHDILDGSAIHPTYEYSKRVYDEARIISSEKLYKSLEFISSLIAGNKGALKIVIYNPLAWKRTGIVEVDIDDKILSHNPCLWDSKGNSVSYQKVGTQICFLAKDVPGLGYKVYYLRKAQVKSKGNKVLKVKTTKDNGQISEYLLENEFVLLKVNSSNGCIHSIFNKNIKKEFVLDSLKPANMFQVLYEKPHIMSSWDIGQIERVENLISGAKVEVCEEGPVFASVKLTISFNKSRINQEIRLYSGLSQIYFITEVDWHERGTPDLSAPMLKVAFPVNITTDKVTCEIPFGFIERSVNGREIPALKWVDISEKNCGVSLLNDSKYGHDIQGNVIRLTLLRSAYEPDLDPDEGLHRMVYALYPHAGGWKRAKTVRHGYELNMPLISVLKNPRNNAPKLPDIISFVEIQPSNLILTCLKKAEEDDSLVMRIYESEGKQTNSEISLNIPVQYIVETDLMEKPLTGKRFGINGKTLNIRFKKHEIKTFKIIKK